ncbi:hypothetical protein ABE288_04715 [Bacillus salipaludis]|uniref:hypothetical protein n=1 Tax=Bacillus salipaludis TaxID=2547811 RepID=UPI003D1B3A59
MYIVAAFEYDTTLEMAISKLEDSGKKQNEIIAVPLDRRREQGQLFDTIHHADGISLLDLACVLAVIGMLLGAIYGFVLTWGPIIWGLLGFIVGGILGLTIKFIKLKQNRKMKKMTKKKSTEVFLTIKCTEEQIEKVENILWDHLALGVGKL